MIGRELLHSIVEQVEDVEVAIRIESDIADTGGVSGFMETELARSRTGAAQRFEPGAIGREDFHRIGHGKNPGLDENVVSF